MSIEKTTVHADASETVPTLSRLGDQDMTVSSSDEDIRGRTVKDKDGEAVGKVNSLMIDDVEQKVRFMEVATGGFLGLGESKTLIPIEAITRITPDEVHISHTREHVAGAPPYDPKLTVMQYSSYWSGLYPYYGYGVWTAPWVTSWPSGQLGSATDRAEVR
jgi:sporulation protein YlmC with PRC-barrel domain